ncbi:protein phosphatase 1 regulatory subunit pprA-like [Osmia bicornis bicornis]|uniref:protein phosphatase 1 regulatory subunit pprA-like n=1 Tax=Osmia bicornis bicornis TaxID=1437191 RepID=UPI001EAF3D0D|nr:protein phosphatase 1 regulatory subunit pprA-like [Osmia bicornis bicornis]
MLAAVTILILSPLLVVGNFFEYADYPNICNNEILTLKGYCSSTISVNFIESPSLKCVSIANSDIRFLEEGSFDGLPNLIYLNLEGNFIPPNKLFSFGNISNITALSLNDQRRNSYYDTVLQVNTVYPKLLYLNLRNTKISRITNTVINPFPQLSYLDLSNNTITSFNFVQLWNNLISLNLADNNIKNIGDGYDLDLKGLSSLEHLSIAHNVISYISGTAFNHTVKLRYLNISDNYVTAFSTELFTPLNSLEVLILDNNKFNDIPLIMSSNITTLSMNCNNITYLMSSPLETLPHLRKLSLAGNRISYIYSGTFTSQGLLEELYLNDNELTHLPRNWYQSMKKLRYLNLSGNKFTSIESVLDLANVALKEVHLDGNPIMFIETGMLKSVPENVTIYLNMNVTRPTSFCRRSYSELSNSELSNSELSNSELNNSDSEDY